MYNFKNYNNKKINLTKHVNFFILVKSSYRVLKNY